MPAIKIDVMIVMDLRIGVNFASLLSTPENKTARANKNQIIMIKRQGEI